MKSFLQFIGESSEHSGFTEEVADAMRDYNTSLFDSVSVVGKNDSTILVKSEWTLEDIFSSRHLKKFREPLVELTCAMTLEFSDSDDGEEELDFLRARGLYDPISKLQGVRCVIDYRVSFDDDRLGKFEENHVNDVFSLDDLDLGGVDTASDLGRGLAEVVTGFIDEFDFDFPSTVEKWIDRQDLQSGQDDEEEDDVWFPQ